MDTLSLLKTCFFSPLFLLVSQVTKIIDTQQETFTTFSLKPETLLTPSWHSLLLIEKAQVIVFFQRQILFHRQCTPSAATISICPRSQLLLPSQHPHLPAIFSFPWTYIASHSYVLPRANMSSKAYRAVKTKWYSL